MNENIVYYKDLPKAGECVVLVYMKHLDIRIEIQDFLEEKGYVEGRDYLLLS
ncbi:MAG: hypothetical protein PF517_03860 [Salinivirgaceae bacterium]|nr:hypothetical protein [Salinivirgaceae bacterium]